MSRPAAAASRSVDHREQLLWFDGCPGLIGLRGMGAMYGRTVIVVEDEPLVRMQAVDMLEEAGMDVAEFDNADHALKYVVEHPFDVAAVFTDVELADGSNGLDLARTVARTWVHIAVTVTSGKGDGRPTSLPKRVRYLPKPWRSLDVLTVVQNAVLH